MTVHYSGEDPVSMYTSRTQFEYKSNWKLRPTSSANCELDYPGLYGTTCNIPGFTVTPWCWCRYRVYSVALLAPDCSHWRHSYHAGTRRHIRCCRAYSKQHFHPRVRCAYVRGRSGVCIHTWKKYNLSATTIFLWHY